MPAQRDGLSVKLESRPALALDGSTVSVPVPPTALKPQPSDVARQAGGPDYEPTTRVDLALIRLAAAATSHLAPAYSLAPHSVAGRADDGFLLAGGVRLSLGSAAADMQPAGLAAAVCSLGPGSENLADQICDGTLEVWLLEAVLLAQLEQLERLCFADLADRAAAAGLCVGRPLVPGVAGVPDAAKRALFGCLASGAGGVALSDVGVMRPLKSFCCWFPLVPGHGGGRGVLDLCADCDRETCAFRRRATGHAIS